MDKITVSIGIPLYNGRDYLFRSLASITTQTMIPDSVIIYDDCSSEIYDDILDKFDLPIKYIKGEVNGGCGIARQRILDVCDTNYLIFLDVDDVLCNNFWVENIHELADLRGMPEVIVPNFWEQSKEGAKIKRGMETQPFCHGKAYNAKYIKRKGLQFPTLRVCEDVGFNASLFYTAPNICLVDVPSYLWMKVDESITRRGDYVFDTCEEYFEACKFGYDGIKKHGTDIKLKFYALKFSMVANSYINTFYSTKRDKMRTRKYERLMRANLDHMDIPGILKDEEFRRHVKSETGHTLEEFMRLDEEALADLSGIESKEGLIQYLERRPLERG